MIKIVKANKVLTINETDLSKFEAEGFKILAPVKIEKIQEDIEVLKPEPKKSKE